MQNITTKTLENKKRGWSPSGSLGTRAGRYVTIDTLKITKLVGQVLLILATAWLLGIPEGAQAGNPYRVSPQASKPNLYNRNHNNPSHKCGFCHNLHKGKSAALAKERVPEDICRACHSAFSISEWKGKTPGNRFKDKSKKFKNKNFNFTPPPFQGGGKFGTPGKGWKKPSPPGKGKK